MNNLTQIPEASRLLPKQEPEQLVKNKVHHIQYINNTHLLLKDLIKKFNSVSSGYLQNYVNWFRITRIANTDNKYLNYALASNSVFVPVKEIKPQNIIS